MPKKLKQEPNEEYLKDYMRYKRVNSLEEFIDVSHLLPQQVAVWRDSFFHHFIYLSRTEIDEYEIKLEFVHKINKKPLSMAASLLSVLESDFIARVALKNVIIKKHNNNEYKLKNGFSLLDFESGVYFLGDYVDTVREVAKYRALSAIGLQEIYSGTSCNCEHFTNWCFIDNPISYQANILKAKAVLADASLNTCKGVVGIAVTNLAKHSALATAAAAGAKSTVASKVAQVAISPLKGNVLGIIIQTPIEAASLTHSCLKMKKAVENGMMTQSDMNKEVTKNVFSSAGSIAGGFGLGVAGAAVGTCILPGPGTIIGGTAGGIVGSISGKFGGTLIGAGAYKIGHKAKEKVKYLKDKIEENDSDK